MMTFKVTLCYSLLFLSTITFGDNSEESGKEKPSKSSENDNAKQSSNYNPEVPLPVAPGHTVEKETDAHIKVHLGFIHAFVASASVIVVSELGDNTFFIAAIMAMQHSRLVVFAGAVFSMFFMTLISASLGYAATVIPRWLTYYVSSALFANFGLKMLREGVNMSPDKAMEEYEEAQADLKKSNEEYAVRTSQQRIIHMFFSRVFIQSFTLSFLAEWGDRSQLATIILAAREEVIGVVLGTTVGHALCTGLAVLGGRFIAQTISVRTVLVGVIAVTIIGGMVFLLFALSAFVIDLDD